MSECGMTEEHRKILRNNYILITRDLQTDQVLPRMGGLFSTQDDDEIKCQTTERKRAEKLIDMLPSKGEKAYASFVAALRDVQQVWLANHLATLGNIKNRQISGEAAGAQPAIGMQEDHRDVLRKYLLEFSKTLDVEKMLKCLVDSGTINDISAQQILEKTTRMAKVDELISNVTKCGPEAFAMFYSWLQVNQPQLAFDFKTKAMNIYPNMFFENKTSPLQETDNPTANDKTGKIYSLTMSCSELPKNVQLLLFQALDAPPNELFDNDWKMLYKEFKLPQGKEEIISQKEGSFTEHVIQNWIMRDGDEATLQCLLCALKRCHHGNLISKIKNTLGRIQCNENMLDEREVVDGMMANIQINRPVVPLKLIQEIPTSLRNCLIEQLDALPQSVSLLGNMATKIMEKRCYVHDASDFMEKMKEEKIRSLFRELKKEKLDIAVWMRKQFPVGSTGPVEADDELRANEMSYLHRRGITMRLEVDGKWKLVAGCVGLPHLKIKYIEQQVKEPAEDVISYWEVRSKTTVGALYDLLVDSQSPAIADLL